jgi:nitrogen regulatory protein PII
MAPFAHEIKALIRPGRLDAVVLALHRLGSVPGITVSTVRGFGRSPSAEDAPDGEIEMSKLEIVVPAETLQDVVRAIADAAWTGQPGDGKIFVTAVDDVVNIRLKSRGRNAI